MKYKIGMKVLIVSDDFDLRVGTLGTIITVDKDDDFLTYEVRLSHTSGKIWFSKEELITNPTKLEKLIYGLTK